MATNKTEPPTTRPARRVARWWLAAATFAIGLLVGVVIAGLLIRSSPDTTSAGGDPASSGGAVTSGTATSTGTDQPGGATVEILVNEECLRAINAAEDAYNTIDRVAAAIGEFDLAALDGIIRELQPLQKALQSDVSACTVKTRLPDGSLVATELPATTTVTPEPTVTVTESSVTTTGTTAGAGTSPSAPTTAPATTG